MSMEDSLNRIAVALEAIASAFNSQQQSIQHGGEDTVPYESAPVVVEAVQAEETVAPKRRAPKKKEPLPEAVNISEEGEVTPVPVEDNIPTELSLDFIRSKAHAVINKLTGKGKKIEDARTEVLNILQNVAKTDKIFNLVPAQYKPVVLLLEEILNRD